MTPCTTLQGQLIGALIGLSRTSFSNPKTENTDPLVLNALSKVRVADDGELDSLIKAVADEKNIISPGCATCPNPCGNTDDYDMGRITAADEDVRAAKLTLLEQLLELSELSVSSPSDDLYVFVFRVLSVLSWDWESDMFQPTLDDMSEWIKKYKKA